MQWQIKAALIMGILVAYGQTGYLYSFFTLGAWIAQFLIWWGLFWIGTWVVRGIKKAYKKIRSRFVS